jgi:hypothetical protein
MNKLSLLACALLSSGIALAQPTVAMDFNKNDCDAVNHHLFAELDAGLVVLMEFVMIPSCTPCIQAANKLQPIHNAFQASHPGRVKWYTIGYSNSYTCPQMQSWVSNNSLSPDALFIQGSSEVNYYGGMGMPTIVVVGKSTHDVFFRKVGFTASDTTNIKTAIESALSTASIENSEEWQQNIRIYPNPAKDFVQIIAGNAGTILEVEVVSLAGNVIKRLQADPGKNELQIDLKGIPQGVYLVSVTGTDGQVAVRRLMITN